MALGWVALFLFATAAGAESACDVDAPMRALLCHVGSYLHSSFNPCFCTHVVFPNQDFQKDAERLKATNPKLKILYKQTEAKGAALPTGADGLYLSLDKPPTKEALPTDLKELVTKLDDFDSAKRAKSKYDGAQSDDSSNELEIILELPPQPKHLAKHYDIKSLAKYVNYFVVPSDNLTDSSQDGLSYHPSRLMGIDDILNADSLVDLLSSMGADHEKVIITLPAFALQFSLKEEKDNMPGSAVEGGLEKMSQHELCKLISAGGWTIEREEDMTAPYAYKNKKWVAFDDATSASIKGKYVLLRNLGGISVSSSEDDDWSHSCSGRPIVDTLHHTLTNLARKSRAAQLLSLQDQIHNSLLSAYSGDVQLSPFRIVRVVDRAGSVHVVRKEAKTEFQCSRQGYFTHPSGCNRFYRCVKFNQYSPDFTVFEYDCPAGLAFDERYEVCVWPGSLPDASACKGSSEIAPVPRSRFSCSQEGYYADPENCRWFFACLDHQRDGHTPPTAYEFRCPFGLVFDNEKLACDWPWKVAGCGGGHAAYPTITTGSIYPGDILEGRLRPAYAQVSDVHVSGGRIPNVEGGLVLGTSLLSGVANQGSGDYSSGSSSYHGNGYGSGNLGAGAYSSVDGYEGQHIADNSGAYVHDPTGDHGGDYLHQEGEQVPYIHQEGAQVPYVHQTDSSGYIHQTDSGAYHGSGSYKHEGDNGVYKGDGDSGAYRGDGNSGSYDNGAYRGENGNGAYKYRGDSESYSDSGSYRYQGTDGAYRGQVDSGAYKYQGEGSYLQAGGAQVSSSGSTVGHQSGVSYVHDTRGDNGGAYVHDSSANIVGSSAGAYSSQIAGAQIGSVATGLATGPQGIATGGYTSGSAYSNDVKTAGVADSGAYLGGFGYVSGSNTAGAYSSGSSAQHSGAYVHDSRGDTGGNYIHQHVPYVHQDGAQVPYVHTSDSGAYKHESDSGAYKHVSDSGAYKHESNSGAYSYQGAYNYQGDNGAYKYQGDNGAYRYQGDNGAYVHGGSDKFGSYYGGKYQVGQGSYSANTNLYQSTNNIYGNGAYVHDNRGDHGGAYVQQGYGLAVPAKTYGINLYQPTSSVVHTYDSSKLNVQNTGYVQSAVKVQPITVTSAPIIPLKPVQYIQPAVNPVVVTTPAPQLIGYQYKKQPVQPIAVTSSPVIPYNPVQYVQTQHIIKPQVHQTIQPVVVSTQAPPVINYSYKSPAISSYTVSNASPRPFTVSSTPNIALNNVQYVTSTTPAPSVHINTEHLTPVQGYVHQQSSVRVETPAVPYQEPVQNVYLSTPTVIKTEHVRPAVSKVSYQQPLFVSTAAPPTFVKTHPVSQVVYSNPAPTYISSTARPISVSSAPVIPLNPVQYNVPQQSVATCLNCAVSQTARPLTVTATPIQPVQQPSYSFTYDQPRQPICTSCATAHTARPITVTSSPVIPYNPVQYSTPAPALAGYDYPKPQIKFETPQRTYTYQQTVQPISVSTQAPAVVSYHQPIQPVVHSTGYSTTVRPITYSSAPVVPLNPVQYVRPSQQFSLSTPAPPVVSYTYQKPVLKTQSIHSIAFPTPAPDSYQVPIYKATTPAPPVFVTSSPAIPLNPVQYTQKVQPIVGYSYPKPAIKFETPVVSTVRPQVVRFEQPQPTYPPSVVSYQPVQPVVHHSYVKETPVQPVVGYSYPKPAVKFETPVVVSTPAPPVVKYEQHFVTTQAPPVVSYTYQPVKPQPVAPITVSSTPIVPYNTVQYVKPAPQPIAYVKPIESRPIVDYSYIQQTPVKPVVGYSYPKPAVKFETPVVVSTPAPPVVKYEQHFVTTQAPPVVSYTYQPVKPQPIAPIRVSSTPVVPYNTVQYVKQAPPKPLVSYNYVSQQPIAVTTPAPVVHYETSAVNYNYHQPAVQTSTVRPFIAVSSTPAVPLSPVQYATPIKQTVSKPIFTYNYVKPQPFAINAQAPEVVQYSVQKQPIRPAITVSSTPAIPLAPVQYVPPSPPKHVFSYNYIQPTAAPVVHETYRVTTPRPAIVVTSTPAIPLAPVQYVQPAPVKPIVNYNYVQPTPQVVVAPAVQTYKQASQRPIVVQTTSEQPFVEYKPVRVRPAVENHIYVPQEPVYTQTTTQQPISYTPTRLRPTNFRKTPIVVTTTEQPLGVSYYEEYFDSKKTGGYEYKQPVVQLKEERIPVTTNVYNTYQGEVHSSSFAPIVVPEIATVQPARRRPVQTYVNTVEEESYYSSTPAPAYDANYNINVDIPRVGVQLVHSTTPEHVVEVTTVAPALKRTRVKGANVDGGYYVRRQKVRVRPVVTTSENYPAFFTTTVKPTYSSTIDLTSPTLYTTTVRPAYTTTYKATSTADEEEIEVEAEDEDSKLIQQVSGGFGSVLASGDSGYIKQGFASSTTVSSLKDGEAIVGVVKKEREQYTGRKRTKVVVVSRLSDFNPLLVGKLGAECSCKSDTKTLDLSKKTRTRGQLFRPTTTVTEISREYLPTSTTPLPDTLTNVDYDDAQPPAQIVEIKPVRKTQRLYTTTGAPIDVSTVEYESSTRPARKIPSASSSSGSKARLDPNVDCQRPGLFRHPHVCNKFYSCNWDEWKKRYTVSVFNCPIHLAFDSKLGACNWPSKGPACSENNLLV